MLRDGLERIAVPGAGRNDVAVPRCLYIPHRTGIEHVSLVQPAIHYSAPV